MTVHTIKNEFYILLFLNRERDFQHYTVFDMFIGKMTLPQVCGPTIPKDCKVLTTLNGMCFIISGSDAVSAPIPSALRSKRNEELTRFLFCIAV